MDPLYFLDEMSFQEANAIMEGVSDEYRNSWEIARFTAFNQAASMGAKVHKLTDIIKFTWDKQEIETEEIPPEELALRKQILLNSAQNYMIKQAQLST